MTGRSGSALRRNAIGACWTKNRYRSTRFWGGTYGDVSKLPKEQRQLLYERAWLLVHYLFMEPTRQGQLDHYLLAVSAGTPPPTAAQTAFGDLTRLEKELNAYRQRSTLQYFKIPAKKINPPPVEVRPLSPAASQVVLLRGTLKYGGSASEAETLAAQVRQIEAQYPGDELVEATLSEAELKTGHAVAAEAAADRALKANPRNTEAMILKGDAIAARGRDAEDEQRQALFDEARKTYIAANKLDTEDPEPLYEYYHSYLLQGRRPTDNAIAGMHYASDLAPQDLNLRLNSAIAYLNEGKPVDARATLVPVAYSPHGGGISEMARRMLADIDAGNPKNALQELRGGSSSSASH